MKRIGFFGGTFNPIHNGHVRLALEAKERFGFDHVELIPAAVPPHRRDPDMLPFALRFELTRIAVAGEEALIVNSIESQRSGPSYTFDTLTELNRAKPSRELWFIMGAGEFMALDTWHEGGRIPELANLAVADRGGSLARAASFLKDRWPGTEEIGVNHFRHPQGREIALFSIPRLEISGSEIRDKWRRGLSIRGLVDARVEAALFEWKHKVDSAWSRQG